MGSGAGFGALIRCLPPYSGGDGKWTPVSWHTKRPNPGRVSGPRISGTANPSNRYGPISLFHASFKSLILRPIHCPLPPSAVQCTSSLACTHSITPGNTQFQVKTLPNHPIPPVVFSAFAETSRIVLVATSGPSPRHKSPLLLCQIPVHPSSLTS